MTWREQEAERKRIRAERVKEGGGRHTKSDISALREAQGDRCVYCNVALHGRGHVDHIIPLSRGGSNGPENLQILRAGCNLSKGELVLGELHWPITLVPYWISRRDDWMTVYKENWGRHAPMRANWDTRRISYWRKPPPGDGKSGRHRAPPGDPVRRR